MKHVGINIKSIRELKNLKRAYLADRLGITVSALGRIERGESEVGVRRLSEIADILGVAVESILSFDAQAVLNEPNHLQASDEEKNLQSKLNEEVKAELFALRKENEYLRSVLERLLSDQR